MVDSKIANLTVALFLVFMVRCYAEHSIAMASHMPPIIACLSVHDVEVLWSHRLEYFEIGKIISPLVSSGCSLSSDPNVMDLLQGDTPKFWPE